MYAGLPQTSGGFIIGGIASAFWIPMLGIALITIGVVAYGLGRLMVNERV